MFATSMNFGYTLHISITIPMWIRTHFGIIQWWDYWGRLITAILEYAHSISVFISWILWAISSFIEQLLQDIQESLPCLDKLSGLLLYSLGTYLTDIIIAHLWEDYCGIWYPGALCTPGIHCCFFIFLFRLCMDWTDMYWLYHCFVGPGGSVCWQVMYKVLLILWIPRNWFFRLKKNSLISWIMNFI